MIVKNCKIILKNVMVMDTDRETKQPLPADKVMSFGDIELYDGDNKGFNSCKFSYKGKLDKAVGESYLADINLKIGNYPEETKKIRHTLVAVREIKA